MECLLHGSRGIAAGMYERKELKREASLLAAEDVEERDLMPVIAITGASSLRREPCDGSLGTLPERRRR